MKVMTISDSPWAPTGFGTNTRCIAAIFSQEGHEIGYAGCQNPKHDPDYKVTWPLGSKNLVSMELLPLLHPGQEKFGEKSFPTWIQNFKPELVFTHLDIQMFAYAAEAKRPTGVNIPVVTDEGKPLSRRDLVKIAKKAYKAVQKDQFTVRIDGYFFALRFRIKVKKNSFQAFNGQIFSVELFYFGYGFLQIIRVYGL